jgi:hypothetical protein
MEPGALRSWLLARWLRRNFFVGQKWQLNPFDNDKSCLYGTLQESCATLHPANAIAAKCNCGQHSMQCVVAQLELQLAPINDVLYLIEVPAYSPRLK